MANNKGAIGELIAVLEIRIGVLRNYFGKENAEMIRELEQVLADIRSLLFVSENVS